MVDVVDCDDDGSHRWMDGPARRLDQSERARHDEGGVLICDEYSVGDHILDISRTGGVRLRRVPDRCLPRRPAISQAGGSE